MIVYNVARGWFTMKADAEAHRKAQGLKPGATIDISINTREELAALLNALCEPSAKTAAAVPAALVDRAYVEPDRDIPEWIPSFLLRDQAEYQARQKRKTEQEGR